MSTRVCALLALLGVTACSLFAPSIRAQTAAAHDPLSAFRPTFESVLTQHGVVGGGFALVRGNDPTETLAFGEARRDAHQPVDDATTYNWASITKTMTAIAILQLRDRGKLSLDDPAVRYVPELRQVHDEFGNIDAITIRHLLTHSSGFRNPTWPWDCDDAKNCDWQPFEPAKFAQVAPCFPTHTSHSRPAAAGAIQTWGTFFLVRSSIASAAMTSKSISTRTS
jgi:CubicO group peptidase (beta-lactamase class C family)